MRNSPPLTILQYVDDLKHLGREERSFVCHNLWWCRTEARRCNHVLVTGETGLENHWAKIWLALRELLPPSTSVRPGGVLLWVDNDAVVRSDPRKLLNQSKAFAIGTELPVKWAPPINSGVWMLRDSHAGREVLRTWLRAYPAASWWRDGDAEGRWRCTSRATGKKCQWAGVEYEQGAFAQLRLHEHPDVQLVTWRKFNNPLHNRTSVQHFYQYHKLQTRRMIGMKFDKTERLRSSAAQLAREEPAAAFDCTLEPVALGDVRYKPV